MNITIRKGTEADYPAIIDLMHQFALYQKTPERVTNTVEQMKADNNLFQCFVAVDEHNKIVGYAAWFFAYFCWTGKTMYLDDLYLVESARGHSVGTRLLQTVIDHARATNCVKLRWQVSNWNKPAIAFYRKMGAFIDDVDMNCHLEIH
ncbi:GNAT family N-acetyltransferase [Longitalea arenae]|uniref:GNAT family N-acetyltransferase n=1 Tax=Longitalea arenae TaxID=2812558 RepID=UPI001966DFFC|nr:GNAT family N-acetyltransferase [Longitalea arenae]